MSRSPRPSVREIAALTARLRALSHAGADADPAERAAFLADKHQLLDRITATNDSGNTNNDSDSAEDRTMIDSGPSYSAEQAAHELTGPHRSLDDARALVRSYLDDVSERVGVPVYRWGLDEADLAEITAGHLQRAATDLRAPGSRAAAASSAQDGGSAAGGPVTADLVEQAHAATVTAGAAAAEADPRRPAAVDDLMTAQWSWTEHDSTGDTECAQQ